jgi:large subunit ribosomal protein L4
MAEIPYFDKDGNRIGVLKIDETIFGKIIKKRLLRQVVIAYEANKRVGTHSTKTRAEVRYSKRKLYPQKHIGWARAGSAGSPKRRHGGVAHGPKPRDYRQIITKKMKKSALNSSLLAKILDNEISVVEALPQDGKTRVFYKFLQKLEMHKSTLIGIEKYDRKLWLSARNIPKICMLQVKDFNCYDVLKYKNLLLTRPAFEEIVIKRGGKIDEEIFMVDTT